MYSIYTHPCASLLTKQHAFYPFLAHDQLSSDWKKGSVIVQQQPQQPSTVATFMKTIKKVLLSGLPALRLQSLSPPNVKLFAASLFHHCRTERKEQKIVHISLSKQGLKLLCWLLVSNRDFFLLVCFKFGRWGEGGGQSQVTFILSLLQIYKLSLIIGAPWKITVEGFLFLFINCWDRGRERRWQGFRLKSDG